MDDLAVLKGLLIGFVLGALVVWYLPADDGIIIIGATTEDLVIQDFVSPALNIDTDYTTEIEVR